MDDLSRFCGQDPACPDSGKRGHGNLTIVGHYGKTQPIRPQKRERSSMEEIGRAHV